MNLLSSPAKQRAVSHVLYESMFEPILSRLAVTHAARSTGTKVIQGSIELPLGHSANGTDQFMRELTTQGRPDLSYFTNGGQPIKPGQ